MRYFLPLLLFFAQAVAWAGPASVTARSRTDITPVLELTVSGQASSELAFGRVTPSALGPVLSPLQSVAVNVRSTTGDPYIVTQTFAGPLQSAKGDQIDLNQVKFRSTPEKNEGKGLDVLTEAVPGAQTVYLSDEKGTSQLLTLDYQLEVPPTQAPGDYSALLTFTVSTV